ncbi:uncharacterized protein LOC110826558 [Zootermopsis nevadensis]|uniref:Kinetochore protein SPC25 n=1 Tax=Zootermopsis nevadensis TaxID=136037 RepID=A0A067RQ39_ZOONE|nr:uncharacterized protein LOC110826558 [Zootermopsis nevadensis]KDR22720.1 hypothetical protein L798_14965 [Zootermopsis nevadensis]
MNKSCRASVSVIFKSEDNILQKRAKQCERILINSGNNMEEVKRIQQMTVGKINELQAAKEKLSKECDKVEVDIHTLKYRELANKEETCALESTILELKKKIAEESECEQHLIVKKIQAERDKEKSQKELIKTHEIFLKAIAYYKKKLHLRLRFDENGLILVHFLDISTPGCQMCSLKLSHDDGNKWNLLGMEPVLPFEKPLANKLETTQDIQGFISHVRKLYIQISGSKKQHSTGKKVSKKP